MIKRSSRYEALDMLKNNPDLNVVDLGCGRNGSCEYADVCVDANDHASYFPDKNFIQHDLNSYPYPFEDKEFDFCWASHILEHIKDPVAFVKEVARISKSGYIEVPTPLIDNLVSGDDVHEKNGHVWWVFYDDVKSKIIIRPRRHIVHKTVDIPELNRMYPFFRESFVIELQWSDDLELEMADEKYFYEEKNYDLSMVTMRVGILGESRLVRQH
jgi:SAM-dependent methyltransferase